MDQKGKMSFSTIFVILVLFYGIFVAYKFILVRLDNTQLKTQIVDRIGISRGPDFTLEGGEKIIRDILLEKQIITPDERITVEGDDSSSEGSSGSSEGGTADEPTKVAISIKFVDNKSKIKFFVKYEVVLDLIFFKNKQVNTVEDEVINVN
jgi:hypothetical protein